jgi:hypothetical protein
MRPHVTKGSLLLGKTPLRHEMVCFIKFMNVFLCFEMFIYVLRLLRFEHLTSNVGVWRLLCALQRMYCNNTLCTITISGNRALYFIYVR